MEYPKTRKEAKESGTKFYFTGIACSRGHIALRKTKGCCIECMKEDWVTDNQRRKEKPKSEAAKAAGRRYYEKNKELCKQKNRERASQTMQCPTCGKQMRKDSISKHNKRFHQQK